MECTPYRSLLPLLAGGELDREERMGAETHVGVCTECARELEEYRKAIRAIGVLKDDTLPAGFEERLWNRVQPGLAGRSFEWRSLPWLRWAAVLLVGASVGLIVQRALTPPRATPPEPTPVVGQTPARPVAPEVSPGAEWLNAAGGDASSQDPAAYFEQFVRDMMQRGGGRSGMPWGRGSSGDRKLLRRAEVIPARQGEIRF